MCIPRPRECQIPVAGHIQWAKQGSHLNFKSRRLGLLLSQKYRSPILKKWRPKDFNMKFYPIKPYQRNSNLILCFVYFCARCFLILFLRLPKDRVQKLKRAYMGWEKGNVIVFGHQLVLLYK